MRIAWTGELGARDAPGVAGLSFLLLDGLLARGHRIDAYAPSEDGVVEPSLEELGGLTLVRQDSWWRWARWYSRGGLLTFVSSSVARIQTQRRLGRTLLQRHAGDPYDVVFQMSQLESFLGRHAADRPPLVVHPCTIARSEARWHHAERDLARRSESVGRFLAADFLLHLRAVLQGRHARRPDLVVGPSERFAAEFSTAYRVDPGRCRVLRHPAPIPPLPRGERSADRGTVRLLFVSRISSRKGVELIVDLSRRLTDLAGGLELSVIGGHTLWSDYSGVLADLDPRVGRRLGELPGPEVLAHLEAADALLVPSRFEPGSIATGEALARGVPVVASSAVGPAEILTERSGRVFEDGDPAAFEAAVRDLVREIERDRGGLRDGARLAAREHLDPARLVESLEGVLEEAAATSRTVRSTSARHRVVKPAFLLRPTQVARRVRPPTGVARIRLPWGLELEVDADEQVGNGLARTGVHELAVTETAWRLAAGDALAVDVGANVGYLTGLLALRAREVLAFEPHPALHARLRRNAASWGAVGRRVDPRTAAVSEAPGRATLHVPADFVSNQGRATLEDGDGPDDDRGARSFEVETVTLDEVLGTRSVGLLKLDVEGHEGAVLAGAARALAEGRIRDVLFEDHDGAGSPVAATLRASGYAVLGLRERLRGVQLVAADDPRALPRWDAPTYLATRDPARAEQRLRRAGWRCLRPRARR